MIDKIVYQFMKKGIRSGKITQDREEYCLKMYTIWVELVLELIFVFLVGIAVHELVNYLTFYLLYVPLRVCSGGNHLEGTGDILFSWCFAMVLITMWAEIMIRCRPVYPIYFVPDLLLDSFIYKLSPVYDEHWTKDMNKKYVYRHFTGWILLIESGLANIFFGFGYRIFYATKLMTNIAILFWLLTGVFKNALKEHDRREAELWNW